jgi:hypothetical protein
VIVATPSLNVNVAFDMRAHKGFNVVSPLISVLASPRMLVVSNWISTHKSNSASWHENGSCDIHAMCRI